MHILDPNGVPSGRKIYTGSGRMSLHLVFGATDTFLLIAHSRGYKPAREGRVPKSLCVVGSKGICIGCMIPSLFDRALLLHCVCSRLVSICDSPLMLGRPPSFID
jgi:hypothetical protein